MVDIVGTPVVIDNDGTFDLTNGSRTGRAVVIAAVQSRSTTNLENFEFDGVEGTVLSIQTTSGGGGRSLLVFFADGDLPSTAGTYAVDRNTSVAGGTVSAVFELENAPDIASMEVQEDSLGSGEFTSPLDIQFSSSQQDAVLIVSRQSSNGNSGEDLGGAGQVAVLEDVNSYIGYKIDTAPDGNLTIDSDDSGTNVYSAIQITEAGPQLSVTGTVQPGDTLTFTATNFDSAINSATLSDGTSTLALTNLTNTSGDEWTADVPGLGDDQQYTTFGEVTLEVGDGTDTAESVIDLDPQTRTVYYELVTLTSNPDTSEESWLYNYGGTPEGGDQATYAVVDSETSAELTLNADGSWSATDDGAWTIYVIDETDGFMESLELTAGDPTGPYVVDVSPTVLVADESFTVTVENINANDIRSVTVSDGSTTWAVPVDEVNSDTEITATAPSDLPTGETLSIGVKESKDMRQTRALMEDKAPLALPSYTVAEAPGASEHARELIYVSDEVGGETLAFSDGTDWRRVQDLAVISDS